MQRPNDSFGIMFRLPYLTSDRADGCACKFSGPDLSVLPCWWYTFNFWFYNENHIICLSVQSFLTINLVMCGSLVRKGGLYSLLTEQVWDMLHHHFTQYLERPSTCQRSSGRSYTGLVWTGNLTIEVRRDRRSNFSLLSSEVGWRNQYFERNCFPCESDNPISTGFTFMRHITPEHPSTFIQYPIHYPCMQYLCYIYSTYNLNL